MLLGCALALVAGCASPVSHSAPEGALGPYSAAVAADGFVFVSGKIGERGGSFAREAETALDGVERELQRQGLTFADVVSATVYLTDMERYAELNEIYAARLSAPYPARACVAVAALPAGARVEVQVVAHRR
jgi:2-iminobutanoate/2-iminopropanoate deaminase